MKKTLLTFTTLTVLSFTMPASIEQAEGASMISRPNVVKVRPNVRPKIARVKPRVRMKAARIKPRVRIKAAKVKPRVRTKVTKLKPRVRTKIKKATPRVRMKAARTKSKRLVLRSAGKAKINKVNRVRKAQIKKAGFAKPNKSNRIKTKRSTNRTLTHVSVLPRKKPNRNRSNTMSAAYAPSANKPQRYDSAKMPGGDIPTPNNKPQLNNSGKMTNGFDTVQIPAAANQSAVRKPNITAPVKPELNVPDGLVDIFRVSGGNLSDLRHFKDIDAMKGIAAMPELGGGWKPGNELPGKEGLGRPRFGAAPGERPSNPSDALTRPGHDRNDSDTIVREYTPPNGQGEPKDPQGSVPSGTWGFYVEDEGSDGATATGSRTRRDGKRDNWTETRYGNGVTTIHQSTTRKSDGTSHGVYIRLGPVREDGSRDAVIMETQNGDHVGEPTTIRTSTGSARTPWDRNGDGRPDGNVRIRQNNAGGGDQGGNYIPPSKNAGNWTPFGGYVRPSHTPFDTISQPDTDEQGTVMIGGGSGTPNIGPEAVTNSGDGGFAAGEGRNGSGGGGSVDPGCIVVSGGCGGGGEPGPGPEGGLEGARDAAGSS